MAPWGKKEGSFRARIQDIVPPSVEGCLWKDVILWIPEAVLHEHVAVLSGARAQHLPIDPPKLAGITLAKLKELGIHGSAQISWLAT